MFVLQTRKDAENIRFGTLHAFINLLNDFDQVFANVFVCDFVNPVVNHVCECFPASFSESFT